MIKKRITEILRKLEYDVRDRRDDITFLVSVSFLISFFIANLWVTVFEAESPVGKGVNYSVGGNLVLGGYHIHHIAYGVLLIIIAAWLSIKYKGDLLPRINAVFFGSGMGLILDELGFIIDGFRKSNDRIWFYGVCVGFAVIMAISSFKPFFKRFKGSILPLVRNLSNSKISQRFHSTSFTSSVSLRIKGPIERVCLVTVTIRRM